MHGSVGTAWPLGKTTQSLHFQTLEMEVETSENSIEESSLYACKINDKRRPETHPESMAALALDGSFGLALYWIFPHRIDKEGDTHEA